MRPKVFSQKKKHRQQQRRGKRYYFTHSINPPPEPSQDKYSTNTCPHRSREFPGSRNSFNAKSCYSTAYHKANYHQLGYPHIVCLRCIFFNKSPVEIIEKVRSTPIEMRIIVDIKAAKNEATNKPFIPTPKQ